MEIKKGKINVFIGATGSGKKEVVSRMVKNAEMCDLFLESFQNHSIEEVLSLQTKSQKKQKEALQMIGFLEDDLKRSLKTLSLGELERLSVAYTLCSKRDNYIFCHPSVGLDAKNKKSLIKLFRLLKTRYKKTIVVISHDSNWVHQFADFLFVVYNNNVVSTGTTYDIFCNKELCKKYEIKRPDIIEFEDIVFEKKKKRLGYRNDIKDLIKDIYRNI